MTVVSARESVVRRGINLSYVTILYNSLEAIGSTLRAGTNCGSCRSEIRAIIDARHVQAAE